MSTILYLYVKKCPHCNLKYFGKTSRKNPYKYKGSGTVWMRHIKKYNVNPETVELYEFNDIDSATKFALDFSKKNNIVESSDWANLIIEKIIGGFDPGKAHSDEHRQKISKSLKGKPKSKDHTENIWKTRKLRHKNGVTNELRLKRKKQCSGNKNPMFGKTHSDNTKDIMRERKVGLNIGVKWFSNDLIKQSARFYPDSVPECWILGRKYKKKN